MVILFKQEIQRALRYLWRYPVETLVGAAVGIVFFVGILKGMALLAVAKIPFDANPDSVIWSYLSWLLVAGCLSAIPNEIQNEAQTGSVEAAFQSIYGTTRLFAVRSLSSFVVTVGTAALTVGIAMTLTGTQVRISADLVLLALLLGITALGLGMMTGGLALVLKKVNVVLSLVSFVLLPIFMTPIGQNYSSWDLVAYLPPLVPTIAAIKSLAGSSAGQLSLVQWSLLAGNAALYAVLGLLFFNCSQKLTKRLGSVSHY